MEMVKSRRVTAGCRYFSGKLGVIRAVRETKITLSGKLLPCVAAHFQIRCAGLPLRGSGPDSVWQENYRSDNRCFSVAEFRTVARCTSFGRLGPEEVDSKTALNSSLFYYLLS